MLLITHDDDDVRWLAQQVVTIEQGRVTGHIQQRIAQEVVP
jgi:ABC-type thiamine transport system ATPase subunit